MPNTGLFYKAVALGSGLMIGIQSTLFTVIGRAIGPARASLVLSALGGVLAGIILITAIGIQGHEHWNSPRSALVSATISVAMGMLIIMGVTFSFQRLGIAAGIATLFLGRNDPQNYAQNPQSLLGKMLRIDVSVPDSHPDAYVVPSDNPFLDAQPVPALGEIWAFGLRNPWRYSFDDLGAGATGALLIGDVGQGAREEVDYEPAGAGGRNYGWSIGEGTIATPGITTRTPVYQPLTNPLFDYVRTIGRAVTGDYVYRGTQLPAAYRGRYFVADSSTSIVGSVGISVNPMTREAAFVDAVDHTAELGGSLGGVVSFERLCTMDSIIRSQNVGESNHGLNLTIFTPLNDLFDTNVNRTLTVTANGRLIVDVTKGPGTPPSRLMLPYLAEWRDGFQILKSMNQPWNVEAQRIAAYFGDFRAGKLNLSELVGPVQVDYVYGTERVRRTGAIQAEPGSPTLKVSAILS